VHRRPRLSGLLAALAPAVLVLAACAGDTDAAPDGDDPACAGVVDRAPATLLGADRAEASAAGVAVWEGDAGTIVMRCGADPLGATSDPCIAVDDVDWVFTADADPLRFQSFGRTPAVELSVPEGFGRDRAPGALGELAAAVRPLASDGNPCD